MKYLVPCEDIVILENGELHLDELHLYVRQAPCPSTEREQFIVVGLNGSPIGGYIGLSRGTDGWHIGSPTDNKMLAAIAQQRGWEGL